MGAQRLRQLDGVFIDPFACVKYICQHLDGGSFSPDFPQVELQGAAGGHLEVLQQVPESCIRKIIIIYFSGLIVLLPVTQTSFSLQRLSPGRCGYIRKAKFTWCFSKQELTNIKLYPIDLSYNHCDFL
jgi:hypothetical protein